MRRFTRVVAVILCITAAGLAGCTTEENGHSESGGEHAREGGERGGDGEESGVELARTETYDRVRNGARLILTFDAASNSFVGTVENTTKKTLERVRVEVHLSNGRELGPTPAGDLEPGATRKVSLKAISTDFERWTAHPEVGNEEHAGGEHGGEGKGEHGQEGEGEHR